MAEIQIRIFPDGRVQGEVYGIKGKKCTDYIRIIEELTKSRSYQTDFTEEFYEVEEEKNKIDQSLYLDEDVLYGRS